MHLLLLTVPQLGTDGDSRVITKSEIRERAQLGAKALFGGL